MPEPGYGPSGCSYPAVPAYCDPYGAYGAKALYNKIAILSRQDTGRSMNSIKQEVLGKRLHKIISGGGYLAPELAANFNRLGISIAQGYGMSECSPKISSPDWSRPDKWHL